MAVSTIQSSPSPGMQKTTSFVHWYLLERPREILALYFGYVRAFGELFSIIFLLKTLFSPWKSIRDNYPDKGFNLYAIMETWSLNVTTRCIGAVIRLSAIIIGILIQVALGITFVAYFVAWLLFPFLVLAGIPYIVLHLIS